MQFRSYFFLRLFFFDSFATIDPTGEMTLFAAMVRFHDEVSNSSREQWNTR